MINISEIKEIINSNDKDEIKQFKIISVLAKSKNVIPMINLILKIEREYNEELINKINLLLSKADVGLTTPELNDGFIQEEIKEFYSEGLIRHCFKQEYDKQ